jgi:hypothetical protein
VPEILTIEAAAGDAYAAWLDTEVRPR